MTSLFADTRLRNVGNDAEAIAEQFMAAVPNVKRVIDVSNVIDWQRREVDRRCELANGAWVNVEIKSDRHIHTSRNFSFELARLHHTATPEHCAYLGWSVFSEADRLLVWCPPAQRLYSFLTDDVRRGMQRYTQEVRGNMRTAIVTTDDKRTTINILVPLSYIPHNVYARAETAWRLEHKGER